jgi:hypothetical protein
MTDEMRDVDHTNPHTGKPFGASVVFERGVVVADGGRERAEMRDVDHTPPAGEGANRVFERGTEGREDSV